MIPELLKKQRSYLDFYFTHLDSRRMGEVAERLLACRGTILCSGVGKSGYIAQKVAATFLSLGIRSIFLEPVQAVHGDLGLVQEGDLLLAFSKSGESDELLELIPCVRKRRGTVVAIVSNAESRLARNADLAIALPVERELCLFDLAPTTSTAVQLLFGDCLAVALMQAKRVKLDDYAMNHPGGLIGKRIALKVADLMLTGSALPLSCSDAPLIEAIPDLSAKRCGCLLIVDGEMRLAGIFTDGDLRRALEQRGVSAMHAPLCDLMTENPRFTAPGRLAIEAMRQMEEDAGSPITVLPVLEEGRVAGLLRMHDILQAGLQ